MKVWLDDVRQPPDYEWVWVKTSQEAVEKLRGQQVTEISLDHDLGLDDDAPDMSKLNKNGTGMDVLNYLEEALHYGSITRMPIIHVHSMNFERRPVMERLAITLMKKYGVA